MARMSRLLSAISLGVAVTAAVGAAVVAHEANPVRKAPARLAEFANGGRVIVKFKARASILSTSNSSTSSVAADVGPQKAEVLGARLGVTLADGRVLGERTQVLKSASLRSSDLASVIAGDSEVEWVEVDHRRFIQAVVSDPLYPDSVPTSVAPNGPSSGQWYLRAPGVDASGRDVKASIDIEPAWAITHGSSSVVIADVDTGITSHPDLSAKLLTGYDFISDVPTANDGNGRDADPSDPGDWVTAAENSNKNGDFYACNDSDTDTPGQPVASNSSWHGTQTGGILAASTNNGTGIAGTAYDTPLVAARALGKCGGFDSDIIAAAQWSGGIAVSGVPTNAHPAKVINMSLGAQGSCTSAYVDALTALRNKGVVVVAAAGNDEGLTVATPANCKPASSDPDQTPIVIAVAGLRHTGTKVGFSDIGPEVTIAAPGGNCVNTGSGSPCLYPIVTTSNSGATSPVGPIYTDGLNDPSLGTSFATPMVTGTVALMVAANPNISNASIVHVLKNTARPFPTTSDTVPTPAVCTVPASGSKATQDECLCTTSTCGAGMLDAGAAVTAALALTTATPPTAVVSPGTASVAAGGSVTLGGTGSAAGSSGGALTYQWSIPDGDTHITLSNASTATVTVNGVSAGTGQVQLKVVDSTNGLASTQTVTVTVTAAASSGGGGGGGGGGAANPAWLAALAVAGLLLRPRGRSRTRA